MIWQAILGSAVLASLLTAILNNAFSWQREKAGRVREARGMLQRARSAAFILLESVRQSIADAEVGINKNLTTLREIMLSTGFATATADIDLDDAYRALESIEVSARTLTESIKAHSEYSSDPRSYAEDPEGNANDDFDPDLWERREMRFRSMLQAVDRVSTHCEKLLSCVEKQQKALRTMEWYGDDAHLP